MIENRSAVSVSPVNASKERAAASTACSARFDQLIEKQWVAKANLRSIACLSALSVLLSTSGCGSTIHRPFAIDTHPATSLSVDAKQRMVFVTDRATTARRSEKGSMQGTKRVLCAEPSPDAIVGVSTALRGDLRYGERSIGIDHSLAEAVAQLGQRTVVVQLLRDGLYRACEAYMNGIIDESEYEELLRHYDVTMVMLIAVEGLTSCTPSFVGVSGSASTSPGAVTSQNSTEPSSADQAEKHDVSKGVTPAKTAEHANTQSTSSSSESAPVTATVTTTGPGSCRVTDKAAEEVGKLMAAFFAYKSPLHRRVCMAKVISQLTGTPDRSSWNDLGILGLAARICDGPSHVSPTSP